MSIRVPVTGGADIKITNRRGQGIALHQHDTRTPENREGQSRIVLSNNDILALVDAIIETAQRNRDTA